MAGHDMGRQTFGLSLALLLFFGGGWSSSLAETRVALVVGNSDYRGENVRALANPQADARLMADALKNAGFRLVGGSAQLNLDKSAFEKALQDFGSEVQHADVGVFYYAGHGLQVDGENYLVPVDANPSRPADLGLQLLTTNLVLAQMEGVKVSILILDACRNNPFASGRSLAIGRGRGETVLRDISHQCRHAEMEAPAGTVIWFATRPGEVAEDGPEGSNSPFAKALATAIDKPGLDIYRTFDQAGQEVRRATNNRQVPWESRTPMDYTFYFLPTAASGNAIATPPPPVAQA